MNPCHKYMLDIETLGTGPNAAIVAIGVCAFDPAQGELEIENGTFYQCVDLELSAHPGVMDPATVIWWLGQSDAARKEITTKEGQVPLEVALSNLTTWLQKRGVNTEDYDDKFKLWSKPPMFDERILREAYTRHGYAFPFHRRAGRDMRTLVDLARSLGCYREDREAFQGEKHNALDDACHQARVVCDIFQAMSRK